LPCAFDPARVRSAFFRCAMMCTSSMDAVSLYRVRYGMEMKSLCAPALLSSGPGG